MVFYTEMGGRSKIKFSKDSITYNEGILSNVSSNNTILGSTDTAPLSSMTTMEEHWTFKINNFINNGSCASGAWLGDTTISRNYYVAVSVSIYTNTINLYYGNPLIRDINNVPYIDGITTIDKKYTTSGCEVSVHYGNVEVLRKVIPKSSLYLIDRKFNLGATGFLDEGYALRGYIDLNKSYILINGNLFFGTYPIR